METHCEKAMGDALENKSTDPTVEELELGQDWS